MDEIDIRPQDGPQTTFLSTNADIAFYGGAAGGGKSFALLLEPLRHIMKKDGFGAVIFRRESPQITNEGGMWDESQNLYYDFGAKPTRSPKLSWSFPPYGNSITFSHMQHEKDRHNWQGAQVAMIGFDELTHFTRKQFFYMLSRNRSACGVHPYVRATYNPVPSDDPVGGWIHDFVGWYLDANGEYPDMSKAGRVRWFVNVTDTLHWFESEAKARETFPSIDPKSFTYIPAFVQDNKILLEKNPQYLANLYALGEVEQQRLLYANHKIKAEAGKVFSREWFPIGYEHPMLLRVVRFWDFAATSTKRTKGAATASVKMGLDMNNKLWILDVTEDFLGPSEVDDFVVAMAKNDGLSVSIRWEEEGGSSGKIVSYNLASRLSGYSCGGIRPSGDKLERSRPLASQARIGNVFLLRGEWNDKFLSHMHNIPDGRFDIHDATAGAFSELTSGMSSYGHNPLANYRG